jgi:hypothetical protein
LRKYDSVFGKIPPGRSLDRGFENTIELDEGEKLVITTSYMHLNKFHQGITRDESYQTIFQSF